jgi:hypothetical protein
MATTIPGQLLTALKARKFSSIAKLYANGVDFHAWNPQGHWVANDGQTVAKIMELWFTPGVSTTIDDVHESPGARGSCVLEYEIAWKLPPDDQPRVLRQVHLMTIKGDKIVAERVYCAGLHTEFPEVDIEKLRRAKGLSGPKPSNSPKAVIAKAV